MNKFPLNTALKQRGMSLVELMVAVTISLLLLAGTIQIFTNSKQTYRVQEALSRLQENGRFAMQYLTRDIRMADFWGCAGSISNVRDHIDPASGTPPINLGDGGVNGTNDTGLNGSDTITLQGAFGSGLTATAPSFNAASFFVSTKDHDLSEGTVIIATDCKDAEMLAVTNSSPGVNVTVAGNTGASPGNLANIIKPEFYFDEGELFKLTNYSYSIKAGASGEPALFRSENGTDTELVEGVENMQIKYGEDTDSDGTANIYRDSTNVAVMENVVSVRITLTLRTIDDNVSLTLADGDKRIRRTFTSTITVRNRVS